MSEVWARWEPLSQLRRKYDIDSVSDDNRGFTTVLSDSDRGNARMRIHFEGGVKVYRYADETLRSALVLELLKKYGRDFYGNWTFFKVTNSEYITWISQQSCTISDHMQLTHFSILAANAVLDIAAVSEPQVEYLDSHENI